MSTVSVAMATYNGARHVTEQLDSLAAQTLPPAEIVVADDGSTDDTLAHVAAFAARSAVPVRALPGGGRLGYRANFMRAAAACTGQLIAFCDQDDSWHVDKLATAAEAFADPEVLLFHHDARVVRDGVEQGRLSKPIVPPRVLEPLQNPPWAYSQGFTQVVRADLRAFDAVWPRSVDYVGVGSERLAHDQWYFFLASVLGRIVYHAAPLADYRLHASNTVGIQRAAGFVARMRGRLEDRTEVYAHLAAVAANAADMLEQIRALAIPAVWQERAARGRDRYRDLAALYELRQQTYLARSPWRRAAAARTLRARRAYDPQGPWTFGAKAAAKDAVLGVLLGPLTRAAGIRAAGGDPMCRSGSGPTSTAA